MEKKLNSIKVALFEKGISQTEQTEVLDKSFCTVNTYCANRQQSSLEVLAEITDFLSVSIKDLILDSCRLKNDFRNE